MLKCSVSLYTDKQTQHYHISYNTFYRLKAYGYDKQVCSFKYVNIMLRKIVNNNGKQNKNKTRKIYKI